MPRDIRLAWVDGIPEEKGEYLLYMKHDYCVVADFEPSGFNRGECTCYGPGVKDLGTSVNLDYIVSHASIDGVYDAD